MYFLAPSEAKRQDQILFCLSNSPKDLYLPDWTLENQRSEDQVQVIDYDQML